MLTLVLRCCLLRMTCSPSSLEPNDDNSSYLERSVRRSYPNLLIYAGKSLVMYLWISLNVCITFAPTVINLSSATFSNDELRLLSYGKKFAAPPPRG